MEWLLICGEWCFDRQLLDGMGWSGVVSGMGPTCATMAMAMASADFGGADTDELCTDPGRLAGVVFVPETA